MSTYFLIMCGVALMTAWYFVWYYRRKAASIHRAYELRVDELEDIAWRVQMNPHFLNNCLNNINAFIHKEDKQAASEYLTCFSRLMRKILEHSEETTISLAHELDVVKHYVKLERLRFGDDILIDIGVDESLDPERIAVPPFFIQPFLENAILHGLLPKQAVGTIDVRLRISKQRTLCCSITDDGVGRTTTAKTTAASPDQGKRSLGMAITRKRIAAFNRAMGHSLPLDIHDLVDASGKAVGTSVEIQLAYMEMDF